VVNKILVIAIKSAVGFQHLKKKTKIDRTLSLT